MFTSLKISADISSVQYCISCPKLTSIGEAKIGLRLEKIKLEVV